MGKNGRFLFYRPKPAVGCSASGRRRRRSFDLPKSWMDLMKMGRVGDRWEKMEGSCSTVKSPQWAVVPVEEEDFRFTPRFM
jgi:hypothetical protein